MLAATKSELGTARENLIKVTAQRDELRQAFTRLGDLWDEGGALVPESMGKIIEAYRDVTDDKPSS